MNTDNAKKVAQAISYAIQQYKLPATAIPLAILQAAHESGGFNSHLFIQANNASGIKANKHFGFNSGIKSPEGDNYAGYDSLNDWAMDFIRILNKDGVLTAKSIDEYANGLKAHGYFTAPLEEYKAALKKWVATFKYHFPNFEKLFSGSGITVIGLILIIIFIFVTAK